jgi:hypothetical protein
MSDYSDARDVYLANADYAEKGSANKAAAFVTACRKMIVLLPSEVQGGTSRTKADENLRQLREEMEQAQRWLASNGTNSVVVVHPSFANFRDY